LPAERLHEEFYGARGGTENAVKQQVLDLEVDKLSTHGLASNPLRRWLASFAHLLIERPRGPRLAHAAHAGRRIAAAPADLNKVRRSRRRVERGRLPSNTPFMRRATYRASAAKKIRTRRLALSSQWRKRARSALE